MFYEVLETHKVYQKRICRTSHLVSIDIRNNRLSREQGIELVKNMMEKDQTH